MRSGEFVTPKDDAGDQDVTRKWPRRRNEKEEEEVAMRQKGWRNLSSHMQQAGADGIIFADWPGDDEFLSLTPC